MAVGREWKTGTTTISPREPYGGRFQPAEDTFWEVSCNSRAFGVNSCHSFAVFAKRSVLGVLAKAGSGKKISKNGGRPRRKNGNVTISPQEH